ncbi:MAG: hypothetical protein NT090_11285 [Acidobacteria bacterium]|nr:hypothetical protein [Acidobacteriota bacterium]
MPETLTHEAIRKMAMAWYKKLDVHAPMVEILPMLAEQGLHMKFPEATLEGLAGFEGWYQTVIRIFFDEQHQVKSVKSVIKGNKAKVKVVVRWAASRWRSPAAYSDRIVMDAYQTWKVSLPKAGAPVVTTYIVDKLVYAKGSARL